MLLKITHRNMFKGSAHDAWFVLDCSHQTIGQAYYGFAHNGALMGNRLETEAVEESDARRVIGRREVIISSAVITQIEPYAGELVDLRGNPFEGEL